MTSLKNQQSDGGHATETTLTKHNDMGHVWPKYGNGMTWLMALLWVIYGICMGYYMPYQTHTC